MIDPKSRVLTGGFERVAPEIVAQAQGLASATVHEAGGKIGVMPRAIKPVHPHFRLCGPAMTVHCPPRQSLASLRHLCGAAWRCPGGPLFGPI